MGIMKLHVWFALPWSKADLEEKEESKECDLMKRCQDAESKEGGRMFDLIEEAYQKSGCMNIRWMTL